MEFLALFVEIGIPVVGALIGILTGELWIRFDQWRLPNIEKTADFIFGDNNRNDSLKWEHDQ